MYQRSSQIWLVVWLWEFLNILGSLLIKGTISEGLGILAHVLSLCPHQKDFRELPIQENHTSIVIDLHASDCWDIFSSLFTPMTLILGQVSLYMADSPMPPHLLVAMHPFKHQAFPQTTTTKLKFSCYQASQPNTLQMEVDGWGEGTKTSFLSR
jgi:hypothetical protein